MAQEITLDTLLQGSGNEEPKRELVDAKTVQAHVEKLTPEQMARVEEVKNGMKSYGLPDHDTVRCRSPEEYIKLF